MEQKTTRIMPKGGRKGGTIFPRINLGEAVDFAKKLVGKTHSGAQPAAVILAGVFGSTSNPGKIRISALKQFGLLKGDSTAYEASDLAKQIAAAPPEEVHPLLQSACVIPPVFKTLLDTFHGDVVAP